MRTARLFHDVLVRLAQSNKLVFVIEVAAVILSVVPFEAHPPTYLVCHTRSGM